MTSETASSSHLMVRTKENVLTGPFPREEVIRRIQNGQLREADEVCAGNGYWIFLHERGETRSLLGVELPRREEFHEESTETGTETETATATATKPMEMTEPLQVRGPESSPSAGLKTRPKGQTESLGTFKTLLLLILVLVGFILFQVFQITDGF